MTSNMKLGTPAATLGKPCQPLREQFSNDAADTLNGAINRVFWGVNNQNCTHDQFARLMHWSRAS